MAAAEYFSADYCDAREKFLSAAKLAGAKLEAFQHPLPGPEGQSLTTDVAWMGPPDAARVLVTISATHGVEGFCGSGAQVGWFQSGLAAENANDVALLAIHAINPHGFAWLRRVTEENVDLNRNYIDFQSPLPVNEGYEELADAICPATWDEDTIAETAEIFEAYRTKHGSMGLQAAIAGGQYAHARGLFYGGTGPTWSRSTMMAILDRYLGNAAQVAVIDYHTGLGPRGYGERICNQPADSGGYRRADDWFGGDITSPYSGTSTSSVVRGAGDEGIARALPHATTTFIALEYGTREMVEVKLALRADNWLHVYGDLDRRQRQGDQAANPRCLLSGRQGLEGHDLGTRRGDAALGVGGPYKRLTPQS